MRRDAKKIIVDVIERLRRNTIPPWVVQSCIDYKSVLENLYEVEEGNRPGQGLCGMASDFAEKSLNDYFTKENIEAIAIAVTSSDEDSGGHQYNIVKVAEGELLLVDLTVSQFFSRPMDAFSSPYFVGTRYELKEIFEAEMEKPIGWNWKNAWGDKSRIDTNVSLDTLRRRFAVADQIPEAFDNKVSISRLTPLQRSVL